MGGCVVGRTVLVGFAGFFFDEEGGPVYAFIREGSEGGGRPEEEEGDAHRVFRSLVIPDVHFGR
jgi:hypothetical protein